MQKGKLHIIIFIMMSGLILSCSSSHEKNKALVESEAAPVGNQSPALEMNDKLTQNFIYEDSLSSVSIDAFKERAIQKLIDFYEYTSMASNTAYDTLFRKKAAEQALMLCSSESNQSRWMNRFLKNNTNVSIYPDSISLKDSIIYMSNEKSYKGNLSYIISDSEITTEFYIKKRAKPFGSQTKQVWEVLLGDSRILNGLSNGPQI